MHRRRLLRAASAAAATGGLAGCGFRPLYMPGGAAGPGASEELAAVYVPIIGERAGQLLRQALQRRLDGSGSGVAKKYELITYPAISSDSLGIQRDNSTTFVRLTGRGAWTLRLLDPAHTVMAAGTSRVLDGYDISDAQYFAVDQANEATIKRIAEELANQIVTQVAIYLKRRAEGRAG